jgi:hypothetical protein
MCSQEETSNPQGAAAPHRSPPLPRAQRGAPDQGHHDSALAGQVLPGAEDQG